MPGCDDAPMQLNQKLASWVKGSKQVEERQTVLPEWVKLLLFMEVTDFGRCRQALGKVAQIRCRVQLPSHKQILMVSFPCQVNAICFKSLGVFIRGNQWYTLLGSLHLLIRGTRKKGKWYYVLKQQDLLLKESICSIYLMD